MSDKSIRKDTARKTVRSDEPTTSKNNEKKTSFQAGHFLKNKHPELFEISPLPGGFRRHPDSRRNTHEIPAQTDTSQDQITPPPTTTKIRTKDRVNIGEILETTIRCPSARPVSRDEQKNDTARMCSIAVSTVMMLAQRTYDDITMEHVRHTQEYFRGLKQPDGYPANVEQLMQLLTNLKKNGKIVPSVNAEENNDKGNNGEQDRGTQMSD